MKKWQILSSMVDMWKIPFLQTPQKIENHDPLILGAFKKYHYIWIYNDAYPRTSLFIVVFFIP